MAPEAAHPEDYSIGEILIQSGFVSFTQVEECITIQKKIRERGLEPKKLGDIMVEKGYLKRDQLEQILSKQTFQRLAIPGFEVQEKVGQGSMGAVYRGRQVSVDRPVAIKILPEELTERQGFIDRFLREVRAIAKLNHPNIVAAIDAGRAGASYYYVMEFIDGASAIQVLKQKGRMSESECLQVALGIAKALVHINRMNLIHRDIKPQNIMITRDGIVKLCDLGLAKRVGEGLDPSITQAGVTVGTPYYLSPELAKADPNIDIRSDIYSLGATLYHLATGIPPFTGPTAQDVLMQHITAPVRSPREWVPELSHEFEALLIRMLQKDPNMRFASPEDLVHELERIAKLPPPVHRKHQSRIERRGTMRVSPHMVTPPQSRSIVPFLSIGIIGVAVLVGIVIASGINKSAPPPQPKPQPKPSETTDHKPPQPQVPPSDPLPDFDSAHAQEVARYAKERELKTLEDTYTDLNKNCVHFAGTRFHDHWKAELEKFVSDANQKVYAEWEPVKAKVEQLRAENKIAAALKKLAEFPDAFMWFRRGSEPKPTRAGDEVIRLRRELTEELARRKNSQYADFVKALNSEPARALAIVDEMESLVHEDSMRDELDGMRTMVLDKLIAPALVEPMKPWTVRETRQLVQQVCSRSKVPEMREQMRSTLDRLDTIYAKTLKRSSKNLAAQYDTALRAPFERLLRERKYYGARTLFKRWFTDTLFVEYQTAMYIDGINYERIFKGIGEVTFAHIEDLESLIRDVSDAARTAADRQDFKPLADIFLELRACLLIEHLCMRVVHGFTTMPIDGFRWVSNPTFQEWKWYKVERLPSDSPDLLFVLRIKPNDYQYKDVNISPVGKNTLSELDVAKMGRVVEHGNPYYRELQGGLMLFYSPQLNRDDVMSFWKNVTAPDLKFGLDRWLERLPTSAAKDTSKPLPPKPQAKKKPLTYADIFAGEAQYKDGRIDVEYDFSDRKQLAQDFSQTWVPPNGRATVTPTNAGTVTISGVGGMLWKGVTGGDYRVEVTFRMTQRNDNVAILTSLDGNGGYVTVADWDIGYDQNDDDKFAIFKYPFNFQARDNAQPLTALEVYPISTGPNYTLIIERTGDDLRAEIFTGRYRKVVSCKDASFRRGRVAIAVSNGVMEVERIRIKAVLDKTWADAELKKLRK